MKWGRAASMRAACKGKRTIVCKTSRKEVWLVGYLQRGILKRPTDLFGCGGRSARFVAGLISRPEKPGRNGSASRGLEIAVARLVAANEDWGCLSHAHYSFTKLTNLLFPHPWFAVWVS
jgi:hypothetical protein